MYRIIGVDGKEYGPVSADQLRQWIAEGRVNLQTQIKPEGATEWQPLSSFPDLVPPAGITPPPPPPGFLPAAPVPVSPEVVSGPAISLIVLGAVNLVLVLVRGVVMVAGTSMQNFGGTGNPDIDKMIMAFSGSAGLLAIAFGLAGGIFILLGGIKMKKLESYGFCKGAAIVAMIPCLSACCLAGIPLGIWALMVLTKPEVKAAFRS
jgi:hypothetical protein